MATRKIPRVSTDAFVREILVNRGGKGPIDSDLLALYQVETKTLTRTVWRKVAHFPWELMFQPDDEESAPLRGLGYALGFGPL